MSKSKNEKALEIRLNKDLEPTYNKIQAYLAERLESELIPLAVAVYKGEMLQSADPELRHRAAELVLNLYSALAESNAPNDKGASNAPLINLNFPTDYLKNTFGGMADLIGKGVKNEAPRTVTEVAETAEDPEDYL